MKSLFLISALAATSAWAQLSGPTPGYVFDGPARELRPIRGFVGAAHLGSALVQDADAASASADGTLAIASRFGSIELIRGFDSAAPARLTLAQEPGDDGCIAHGVPLAGQTRHQQRVIPPPCRHIDIARGAEVEQHEIPAL